MKAEQQQTLRPRLCVCVGVCVGVRGYTEPNFFTELVMFES